MVGQVNVALHNCLLSLLFSEQDEGNPSKQIIYRIWNALLITL